MKVLCVERDFFALRQMKREVPKIVPEAEVHYCRDPDKAKELAETEGCDVLLTGIDMGAARDEGVTLAEKVKRLNPRVNIIFVTVCEPREYANRIIPRHLSGYIIKPYEPQELAEEFANLRYAL